MIKRYWHYLLGLKAYSPHHTLESSEIDDLRQNPYESGQRHAARYLETYPIEDVIEASATLFIEFRRLLKNHHK